MPRARLAAKMPGTFYVAGVTECDNNRPGTRTGNRPEMPINAAWAFVEAEANRSDCY
jgi:hypothetical protein